MHARLWTAGSLLAAALVSCSGERQPSPTAGSERSFLTRQLVELRSLPAPEEVAAEDWAALKSALAAVIEQRLAAAAQSAEIRSASAAPVSDGAKTTLLYDLDNNVFEWRYFHPGDYNQDGEVNISDLTPLGARLGQAVPTTPGGEDSIQAVVDGNGDGLVTIADITPLGAYLGRRITAFNLYYGATPDLYPDTNSADSEVPPLAAVDAGTFTGSRSSERVSYSFVVQLAGDGLYWVRPVDEVSGLEGTPSTGLQPMPYQLFEAGISVNPPTGAVPLAVTLDGSDSYGEFLEFFWDPDGDGAFFPAGSTSSIAYIYDSAGTYFPTVRIKNANGYLRSASVAVNAGSTPQWYRYTLPEIFGNLEDVRSCALGMHQGKPYMTVAYVFEPDTDALSYYYGLSTTGSAWSNVAGIFTTGGDLGRQVTATNLGLPLVLHGGDNYLTYQRKLDDFPGGLWEFPAQTIALAPAGSFEWFSYRSLGGFPGIAYYDPQLDNLQFVLASAIDGSAWFAAETPVAGSMQGLCASLNFIADKPAIAYHAPDGFGGLYYVTASAWSNPVPWTAPVQVTLGKFRFFDGLLELADGSPAVIAHKLMTAKIQLYRAASATGAWTTVVDIADTDSDTRTIPRAVMVGDIPHAFWVDVPSASLLHAAATDSSGQAWGPPEVVSSAVDIDVLPAPAAVHGFPAVAFASSNGRFRYAIRY